MHFPEEIYSWLVSTAIISNTGEQDEKGNVNLPQNVSNNFDNGFLVGEIIRRLSSSGGRKVPNALATVKSDNSKNTKLTNWNFIWLAFDAIGLKMDSRIKELILQGEQALIVQVVRQLYERDQDKDAHNKVSIRMKSSMRAKGSTQAVDIKKINLSKDPEQSQTSLEFLMLLLKTSLGMNLQEILGLFTNQNKYLAHIIVKGVNDNFDSIILFYSLLNKHSHKLKSFYDQDSRDAQACLYALKPGFISKNQKVAELTIELFGKLGNLYLWFTGEQSKCSGTLLLGLKRHPSLRQLYWILLLQIIEGEQMQFFTKYYLGSFQNQQQLIEITTFLIKFISQSFLSEKLHNIGIISSWLLHATKLPEENVQSQIICFRFIGELMFFIPEVIEQNEECLLVFQKKWYNKTLPEFVALLNELIVILQRLGEGRNNMARKIYQSMVLIAKNVGAGDKRDYLVQNFLPLLAKFPTIPSEYLIKHLRRVPLSNSEYLLVCQSIQINKSVDTLVAVGNFLKSLFVQNPLLNYYLGTLLKEIIQKVMDDSESGVAFFEKLLEDVLQLYSSLQLKYKPKPKQQQSLYFGRKGSPQKINKQQQDELTIKQKWKQIILGFVMNLLDLFISQQNQDMKEIIKQKVMDSNSQIRLNNHKIGSKPLEEILYKKFGISKEEQVEHSQQFSKKQSAQVEESMLKKSKAHSQSSLASKLKGPQNLTKQFQLIVQKRRQEEEQKKMIELKKQIIQQKKKINAKKELQISNLLRGQIGEAQIRQLGFLQRLVQQPKSLQVIPLEQLETRQVEAIESIFKKYHRVLRHLFLSYTWTTYNSHSNQRFEDNQQRKETLNAVELGKLLKDYKLAFLTNQPQIGSLLRDVNVKLLNKREVVELDFVGFQHFIIQFCALIMTRNYSITNNSNSDRITFHHLRKEPLHVIIKELFVHLKNVFIAKGQKLSVFDDVSDIPLTKQQAYQIQIFTRKLQQQPNYILPKGYKKVSYNTVEFEHKVSQTIYWIPQPYIIAVQILDSIFSQPPFNTHIMEDISVKKTVYKIKPTSLGERAMSTFIQRKSPKLDQDTMLKRSSSRGVMLSSQKIGSETKLGSSQENIDKDKADKAKAKKIISLGKLLQLQKSRFQIQQKKAREKQQQRLQKELKEKEEQRKRKEQAQKFIEEQKVRQAEKRKKEAQQRDQKIKEHYEQQAQKKEKKQQFKVFHQAQLQKIKKISEEAFEKARKDKQIEEEQKERQQELKRRLRQKIEQQDKKMLEKGKQLQKNIQHLYQSQPIKRVFTKFNPNLKALYDFLIQNTFFSLTERKHNNQIVFDTWKYFLTTFELSIIMHPKDISFIFKNLTKDKLVSKEYLVGLNYNQFQQALLRIAIKYKVIFNIVAQKIKDNIKQPQKHPVEDIKKEKEGKKVKKGKEQLRQKGEKDQNEFDNIKDINIRDILKQNTHSRDSIDQFGDTSKVTDKTLIGLVYYLKVPNSKHGQEKRFRSILALKPTFSHHSQRLKQKLNEQYTLQSPQKKIVPSKSIKKLSMPQKLK